MKHSHYFKPVAGLEHIDVYRTLLLFGVTDPCLQHAIKKLLVAGGRGAKDIGQDVQEAIDTLERWKTMRQEEDQPARHLMTPNMISYPAVEVGINVDFDQTGRQKAVEQNGNDGAIYSESGYCLACRSHRYAYHDANCPLQPKAQSDLSELAIQAGGAPSADLETLRDGVLKKHYQALDERKASVLAEMESCIVRMAGEADCWREIDPYFLVMHRPGKRYDVKFEAGHVARDVSWQFIAGNPHGAKFYRVHVPGETDA